MSLSDLHHKIEAFERQLDPEFKERSQCRQGCSRCCYVDLSVFQIEADFIRNWFHQLSSDEKQRIIKTWESPALLGSTFAGSPATSCPFLVEDSCTIYQARPVICRTQGLPLRFHDAGDTYVDICPLNESMLENANPKDFLNLELLNLLLSRLEQEEAQAVDRPRLSLKNLREELIRSSRQS